MTESAPLDEHTMKLGLLMESAQTHQRLAEMHLEKLRAHTHGLDGVVRDEIRRTLLDELQAVTAETDSAARALRGIRQASEARRWVWNLATAALCALIPLTIVHWALPSEGEIATLRQRRDAMAANLAGLERAGGRVQWRLCGRPERLCVRIDRAAPVYGGRGDYMIVGVD